MMRSHHGAMFVLVILLCAGMMLTGRQMAAGAQDVPIEPIGGDSSEAELVVNGQRYLRDREVLVNPEPLQELADEDGNPVYQKPGESDPVGAVYVLSTESEGQATRYLPELVGNASAVCLAELVPTGTIQGEDATFASVGPETDMSADQLTQIGATGEGATIYAYSAEEPLDEILLAQSQGEGNVPLVRYMRIDESSVPATFGEELTFAGQEFVPAPGKVTSFDGLVKVGCAGLFPAWAASSEQPFSTVILAVAGQAVSFEASAADGAAAPEGEASSPVATPTEIVATPPPATPTEAPTEAPTDVPPTATSVPPTATTVPPTATATAVLPTATATSEPPTEAAPTATTAPPTATATVSPTEVQATATTALAAPTDVPPTPTTMPTGTVEEEEALPTEVPPTPGPGTPEPTLPPARPTPTQAPLQPQAVVPTLPPDAPPPPASRATGVHCTGVPGRVDANGVPERLPRNIQYAGSGYQYSGQVARSDAGELTDGGCAGPFVISTSADDQSAIFLGLDDVSDVLFRFEKTASFTVRSQVSDQPRAIQTAGTDDQPAVTYRAGAPLLPSVYSSVSLILYVEDPADVAPDRILGYAVDSDVIGEYVPEGAADQAAQDVLDRAGDAGIHPQLLLGGQRYVLTTLWTPFGTTTNGWMTLYGVAGDPAPVQLAGIDPRQPNLLLFDQSE